MNITLPLNIVPSSNQTSKRSTFNLPIEIHHILDNLSKKFQISIKDLFDDLVAYADSDLTPADYVGVKARKTYVLTPATLNKLTRYAQINSISRDVLIVSLVYKLVERLHEITEKLSPPQKIDATKRIQVCAQKALVEWNKCQEDITLLKKYDPAFCFTAKCCEYIDQLNELPQYLEAYINKTQKIK